MWRAINILSRNSSPLIHGFEWKKYFNLKTKKVHKESKPFDVDVTHVFSCDAGLIQSHFCGVPDDSPQEVPVCLYSWC